MSTKYCSLLCIWLHFLGCIFSVIKTAIKGACSGSRVAGIWVDENLHIKSCSISFDPYCVQLSET